MHTIGIVAGSFDPITNGHAWLIAEAARLVDELHIAIGVNPQKKYTFSDDERKELVGRVVDSLRLEGEAKPRIHFLRNDLLIQLAGRVRATHLIRGIRNSEDFNYETQMALVNRRIDPEIRTVYMAPPPELSEVSSSTVKGIVGFTDWEPIVAQYVHPVVLEALRKKTEGTTR
jgi:pantetheine-phosphate adenylyltransferase